MMQHFISFCRREHPLPLQHIMQMGLGDSDYARQIVFADFPALNALLQVADQFLLQPLKIHEVLKFYAKRYCCPIFPLEIEEYEILFTSEEKTPRFSG
jgi:hypothetical protein